MKNQTELSTAKELCKNARFGFIRNNSPEIYTHLQTCKRWLEFLESYNKEVEKKVKIISKKIVDNSFDGGIGFIIDLLDEKDVKISPKDKISDLQETIKFYSERGIK